MITKLISTLLTNILITYAQILYNDPGLTMTANTLATGTSKLQYLFNKQYDYNASKQYSDTCSQTQKFVKMCIPNTTLFGTVMTTGYTASTQSRTDYIKNTNLFVTPDTSMTSATYNAIPSYVSKYEFTQPFMQYIGGC